MMKTSRIIVAAGIGLGIALATLLPAVASARTLPQQLEPGLLPTSTTLSPTPSPSQVGEQVTVSATVRSLQLPVSGRVTFSRDGVTIADATLDRSGRAQVSTVLSEAGTYEIAAHYHGDLLFAQSRAAVAHEVHAQPPAPSPTPVASAPSPAPRAATPTPASDPSDGARTGHGGAGDTSPNAVNAALPASAGPSRETTAPVPDEATVSPGPGVSDDESSGGQPGQDGRDPGLAQPPDRDIEGLAGSAAVPTWVDAIPRRAAVVVSPERIAAVSALSVLILIYIGFVTAMFNQTFEENYERIRGKFAARLTRNSPRPAWRRWLGFLAYVLVCAITLSWMDPGFAFNRSSAVLAAGLAVGIVVVSVIAGSPFAYETRFRLKQASPLRVRLGAFPVLVVCVGISRMVGFVPGFVYGLVMGFTTAQTRAAMGERRRGQLAAISAAITLLTSIVAWIVWSDVHTSVLAGDATGAMLLLDATLAAIFVLGLQGTAFRLIPIRPFVGARMYMWRKGVWAALEGLAIFGFILVLLTPSRPDVLLPHGSGAVGLVVVLAGFGLVSVALWSWSRLRPAQVDSRSRTTAAAR